MSEQLAGVIVGAAIAFAGTALITLFQWYMEKEKRREERVWWYRQEHLQRLRPAWERMHGRYLESLTVSEKITTLLDGLAGVDETKRHEKLEEMVKELRRIAESHFDVERLQTLSSEAATDAALIASTHHPKLAESIRTAVLKLAETMDDLLGNVQSLLERFAVDVEVSPAEITKATKRLDECRGSLIETMREVETSIERYVTEV